MSYILDALQRAALERERSSGTVPGLQTRSIAAEAAAQKHGVAIRYRWSLLALFIVLAIAALGFIMWRTPPVNTPLASSPVGSAPPAAPIAATTVAVPAVVSPTASAPAPISVNPLSQSPSTSPAPVSAAPPKATSTATVSAPHDAPRDAPKSAPVTQAPTAPKLNASAPQTPKATLPFLKDLPDALRTQIPQLSISGVVYSDNPAQRLLLLNGQVLTQGSRAAEDLVLDEIHPRSSDFTFKGTRFKISH
jgi:general secretion pathway protein B